MKDNANRREFVACCVCASCAGVAGAATPSSRNVKTLKPADGDELKLSDLNKSAKNKNYDIAYCGIYCASCKLYLEGNDKTGKKCKRCTNPSMTSKCAVFNCATEKKVANCGLCPEFETCEILKKHHDKPKPLYRQVARRTCEKIKENGMEVTAAELKKRWTCPHCGKMFAWQTKGNCPHCNKPVEVLSEKDLG
ncbi:MAG: DUF3795 domain-containing protein [Kiritimatiellae bacterium]|jgi:hypothetical protein|nr:DUF3795 domain-containing protein [Kiritimatiellia bacterium]